MELCSAYEPIDLCSCYYPKMVPPLDFLEECRRYWARRENLFSGTIERKIGNTCYVVSTECSGAESLAHKVKRLIFSGKEALC